MVAIGKILLGLYKTGYRQLREEEKQRGIVERVADPPLKSFHGSEHSPSKLNDY